MNNETPEEQRAAIARLSGQAMALQMGICALIAHHPEREKVGTFLFSAIEALLDVTLAQPLPEEVREYLDSTREQMLRAVQAQI